MTTQLDALDELARRLLPALQRTELARREPIGQEGNTAPVAALMAQLQQASPEAGRAYWLTRGWSLLTWQPLYLAILAVHGLGRVPALANLLQYQQEGMVAGYWLNGEMEAEPDLVRRIERTAAGLRPLLATLAALMAEAPRPRLRAELLADDLLVALERLAPHLPELAAHPLPFVARRWLAALELPTPPRLPGDDPRYLRQRCCLHYKRSDGVLCDNCPRRQQALAQRVA
ncbi:siderophore ferric iron reductase [Aeromonas simiae]|uniref:siderophore ferric iron reductase n=1 Tax=Aeromonas simiae TaxID=218936 RepID=UPI000AAAA979|nr:siderophore ferric iron reductase [Aeromonas simiae]MDO2949778.1 siderophore ferric iron reductase [Aeromonas simiae]MDO2951019.1 siderophore ferric iron reductase [Aeromonas simiae]MDO2957134.1 siderophore ferric iron reductase [Aeromonas simiae]